MPRPRLYATNALRQAAYRARKARREAAHRGPSDAELAQALRYLHLALGRAGQGEKGGALPIGADPLETAWLLLRRLCPLRLRQVSPSWCISKDGDPYGLRLYEHHYSCRQYRDGRRRRQFVGPGEKMVLLSPDGEALLVWRKFRDDSGQHGVNCAVFRNEKRERGASSRMIREAMALAWRRWPEERLYTFVNAEAIRSTNPGWCFKAAGWSVCGRTRGGLVILEASPSPEAACAGSVE